MRWIQLSDIDSRFEISEMGDIRYFNGKEYKLKYIYKYTGKSKYALNRSYVDIKSSESKCYSVDSLVAYAFLGIPLGTVIYHKDGDYTNNYYKNLSSKSSYTVCTDIQDELWLDIHGYEGVYQISNYGNVRTLEFVRNGRLHPSILHNLTEVGGYLYVSLYSGKGHKQVGVHRLVAEHFLDCPNNFRSLEVNHKDFNTQNNYYKNLQWVTRLENVRYSSNRGRMDNRKHPEAKLVGLLKKTKPIKCIDTGKIYLRQHDCENELGLWSGAVQNCLKKNTTSHGYSFCQVDIYSEEFIQAFRDEFHRIYPETNMSEFELYFKSCNMEYLIDF